MNACLAIRACAVRSDSRRMTDPPGHRPGPLAGPDGTAAPGSDYILVDGAHNPQGCQALAATLNRLLPGQPVVFLAGFLADKDYETMLRIMLEQPPLSACGRCLHPGAGQPARCPKSNWPIKCAIS